MGESYPVRMVSRKTFHILGIAYAILAIVVSHFFALAGLIRVCYPDDGQLLQLEKNGDEELDDDDDYPVSRVDYNFVLHLTQSILSSVAGVVLIVGIVKEKTTLVLAYRMYYIVISTIGLIIFLIVQIVDMVNYDLPMPETIFILFVKLVLMFVVYYLILWILDGVVEYIEGDRGTIDRESAPQGIFKITLGDDQKTVLQM
ncbi:uncharacterized protein LOC119769840 [Culex quinquefasciatus]|uniref:uncharacterized protein LOC119769840 n=1 Tax=Culex quinquefasciatus TaxID=7176 RepID=UPI0018E2F28E|nr:uncharacterized protein LOC119769840 [Culex quinquefasciatus]XP_039429441.1 uncharacterized protein LOC120412876 [Culex pipiens pallens]